MSSSDDLTRIADGFSNPEELRVVRRGHLRWFGDCRRVLDVGCGSGMFLELLREAGVEGVGVDSSPAAAEACRTRGLAVECGAAVQTLEAFADQGETFDGVMLSHVVEHMSPEDAALVFTAAAALLQRGGKLVVATPNPKSLIVLTELFWLDPTHVRPYPRALLERLGAAAGLEVSASFDDPATVPRRSGLRRWIARLRSALSGADRSGPLDSVVVFSRP